MEHTEHTTTAVHTSATPTPSRARTRTHRWRRDTVELAAVFVSVTAADLVAKVVVKGHDGPVLLAASAVALLATTLFHTWWSHRQHLHGPPPPAATEIAPTALWRVRATVEDSPAGLARVCTAFAEQQVMIVSMQSHPLPRGAVDEFFLRAPHALSGTDLAALVTTGGHDLLDAPTRIV